MSELEGIIWALVALFILTITATAIGWQFIRKYEKLKLEFTTQRLQQFEEMLKDFIRVSSNEQSLYIEAVSKQDQSFHQERIIQYKEFLMKMQQDYTIHANKVNQLNQEFELLNNEIQLHTEDFNAINPLLKQTIEQLGEEDKRIKQLIEQQLILLQKSGKQYQDGFQNLFQKLKDELSGKSVHLEEIIEHTHQLHNDKIKEYSSELCNEMVQLGKKLSVSQEESLKNYKDRLSELTGTAEQNLKRAVKDFSLNKVEDKVGQITEFNTKLNESVGNLKQQLLEIMAQQDQLSGSLKNIHELISAMKENKGLFKKLF